VAIFGKQRKRRDGSVTDVEDEAFGLFLFDDVPQAIHAENVLMGEGYQVKLVAPPRHLRAGCDLAIALARVEGPGAQRLLDAQSVHYVDWVDSAEEPCTVTDLVTTVDFGDWLMVRSGNMKITVDKVTRTIVNTSGGGCPDIPYLNLELVGKRIDDAPHPKDLGYTLCGLMLDRAFLECQAILGGDAS